VIVEIGIGIGIGIGIETLRAKFGPDLDPDFDFKRPLACGAAGIGVLCKDFAASRSLAVRRSSGG
jgi:hypothetical protein